MNIRINDCHQANRRAIENLDITYGKRDDPAYADLVAARCEAIRWTGRIDRPTLGIFAPQFKIGLAAAHALGHLSFGTRVTL